MPPVKPVPVNGQKLCEYANVPFGWWNMGYNGCVVLALYNALILSGYDADVYRIRDFLHRRWKPRIFGVRAWEAGRYLRKGKISYKTVRSTSELLSAMRPGSVAVVLFWNRTVPFCDFSMGGELLSVRRFPDPFGGAHGMAVALREDGTWQVFNRYSNRTTAYEYKKFEDFCPFPSLFMKGFILTQKTTES